MSLLQERPGRVRPVDDGPASSLSPLLAGALAGVRAAAASLVLVLAPVVLAWVSVPNGAGWFDAVRIGFLGWLLAHHGGVMLSQGHLGLAPLGLSLLPMVICFWSTHRLARVLDPVGAAVEAGSPRARPSRIPIPALAGFVGAYLVITAVIALSAGSGPVRPVTGQALLGAFLICGGFGVWGAAAYRAGGARAAGARAGLALLAARVPVRVRAAAAQGALAVGLLLGAGLILVLIAVGLGWRQVLAVHQGLDPGAAGSTALVVLQLAYLPTLAVWAAGYLCGPGFAVGVATTVTPQEVVLGPLPALPVLGGLPDPGVAPGWLTLVVIVPVLAGAVVGVRDARRRTSTGLTDLAVDGALAAAFAAVALVVLSWVATGAVGSGRMAVLGPDPLLVGGVGFGEFLIGAWIGIALWRGAEVLVGDR